MERIKKIAFSAFELYRGKQRERFNTEIKALTKVLENDGEPEFDKQCKDTLGHIMSYYRKQTNFQLPANISNDDILLEIKSSIRSEIDLNKAFPT